MSKKKPHWLVFTLLLMAGGCMLGPQPEPPDVTGEDGGTGYNEGDTYPPDDFDPSNDGYIGEEPRACDEDLAGGAWDCGCDRDGHEPPGDLDEIDAGDQRLQWPGPGRAVIDDSGDDDDETAYDHDAGGESDDENDDGDPVAAD
jgi:hypothetical protein